MNLCVACGSFVVSSSFRFFVVGADEGHKIFLKIAFFRLSLQPQFVRYTLHIWQLGRSDGGVAPTVTLDDLDPLL